MFTIGGSSRGESARIGRDYDPGGFSGGQFTFVKYDVFITFQKIGFCFKVGLLGRLLARFWYHFGSILAPSWVTLGAFGHPMGTFGTLWGAFGTPFRSLDPSWRLLQSLMSSLGRFLQRFRTFS